MPRVAVVTSWIGTDTYRRPRLGADYPTVEWTDLAGTPSEHIIPAPNATTVEARMDEATLALVEADPNFAVIWVEDDDATT